MMYFNNHSNSVMTSLQGVYLTSSITFNQHGLFLTTENLRKGITLYAVRCLSKHTWITDQDRYIGRT